MIACIITKMDACGVIQTIISFIIRLVHYRKDANFGNRRRKAAGSSE